MPALILLPFGVFFICCILQFWYLKKVRDALIDRHSETFLAFEKASFFPMQGIWKFARGSHYKNLHDPELSRHVRNLRRLMAVAIVSWAVYGICLFAVPLKPPRLPLTVANGSFANKCCGAITFAGGQLTVSGQHLSYVVESDKRGLYVLPSSYVGASPQGFVVRRQSYPLKLYLDGSDRPTSVKLTGDRDGAEFTFQRLYGR